jgi:tetratricopeptide (TPR) repeat protein
VEAREQSHISDIQQNVQINAELRKRELQLRAELTRALLELAEESQHPLCLFIDGYERLAEMEPELVGWLWEELLTKLARTMPQPFLVVTCGWHWPENAAIKPFAHQEALDDFDEARVSSYLHKQGLLLADSAPAEQQELLTAFCDLTKGHPLVLALAATYYKELPEQERTPASLRAHRPLLDERARVEWLSQRLLNRLPEPYRTLLERGPVLRTLDQASLRVLACAPLEGATSLDKLDNRTYEQFLLYPFMNQGCLASDGTLTQPTFHDLVRHVQLEALRHHHPQTWEQLHRVMAAYYGNMAEAEYQRDRQEAFANKDSRWWLTETPEKEFQAQLNYLYHALQVNDLQTDAFVAWSTLIGHAVKWWWRQQARRLLEMLQQLIEEAIPFLSKTGAPYGRYLLWYSRFLGQETRWEEARMTLEEAIRVFEQVGHLADIADSLTNIGFIYHFQGNLEKALRYYKRAVTFDQQRGDPTAIADSLTNIGTIYTSQGKLVEALDAYKRALAFYEQTGNPTDLATLLNNLGHFYQQQGKTGEALRHYERALIFGDQAHDPILVASSLTNIGTIYTSQGKWEEALDYFEQALALNE